MATTLGPGDISQNSPSKSYNAGSSIAGSSGAYIQGGGRTPPPDPNALFNRLLEYKWRGSGYPATSFDIEIEQDHAEHKYPDRNGADVEAMGRAPLKFSARFPMLNTIAPGPNESWKSPLYPGPFRQLIKDMADKSPGPMQHPEFGIVQCVPKLCKVVWSAEASQGVYVDCTWTEATFSVEDSDAIFASSSPIGSASMFATNLDACLNAAIPNVSQYGPQPYSPSFADMMRSIQAIGDQVSLLEKQVGGSLDEVAYRVDAISTSFASAVTSAGPGGVPQTTFQTGPMAGLTLAGPAVLYWPLRMAADGMSTAIYALRQQILTSKRGIRLYVVPMDATLASIAVDTKSSITDLITLNRSLLADPIVSQGTTVRCYVP